MGSQRRRRVNFVACGICGSEAVHPRYLVSGFLPFVNDHGEVYHCDACARDVPHLTFEEEAGLRAFQASLREPARPPAKEELALIPILPTDTRPPGDLDLFDSRLVPVRFAHVVGVTWSGYGLAHSSYRLPFKTYWEIARGLYTGDRLLLMDLAGMADGRPHFGVLKELLKGRYNVWLEMGVRTEEDIMDGLVLDAERVLLGTMTGPSLELLHQGYDLAEATMPCLYVAGDLLWRGPGSPTLEEALRAVAAIGYPAAAVVDLPRLGTGMGPKEELVHQLSRFDLNIYLGGGVRAKDAKLLAAGSMAGGLLDPYLPELQARLPKPEVMPAITTVPSPQAWGDPRGRPAPG